MSSKSTEGGPRSVYLITYSQADVLKVRSRKMFADLICEEFNRDDVDTVVDQWAVAAELHKTEGIHYHCSIKLRKVRRWKQVRANLLKKYGIHVDFLEFHDTYFHAFEYIIKQDTHYVTSPGHRKLDNSAPQTSAAISAKRKLTIEKKQSSEKSIKKRPRMDNSTIYHIIVKNDLKTDNDLCAFSKMQLKEGNEDIHKWMMNHHSLKSRQDILDTAWRIQDSEKNNERESKSLINNLHDAALENCRTDPNTGMKCCGKWFNAALDILERNDIKPEFFAGLIHTALKHGRGKGRNVMIIGETNCAKSFMLMPLLHIYDCFTSPSGSTFNFVGAHEKEVLVFNDLRYEANGKFDKEFMPWRSFLNLLEGAPINVPMPKNHYSSDVTWTKKQPVFATSDRKIIRLMNNHINMGETSQMDERWIYIRFTSQLQQSEIDYNLVHCPRCFAEFILTYGDI